MLSSGNKTANIYVKLYKGDIVVTDIFTIIKSSTSPLSVGFFWLCIMEKLEIKADRMKHNSHCCFQLLPYTSPSLLNTSILWLYLFQFHSPFHYPIDKHTLAHIWERKFYIKILYNITWHFSSLLLKYFTSLDTAAVGCNANIQPQHTAKTDQPKYPCLEMK